MTRRIVLFVTLFVGFSLVAGYSQANKLVLVSPGPGHPMYDIAIRLLPEAAQKVGYEIEFRTFPPNRANAMLDSGEADGYLFADEEFQKSHPSAVMVKAPLGHDELMVFVTTTDIKPHGWASLKPFSIGYMTGMVVVETALNGMKLDAANSPPQAFVKLLAGRTDVVVLPRFVGYLFKAKYPDVKMLEPPLEKVALYMFLSAKRAPLATKLAVVLTELQKSGRIQTITDEVMANLQR